MFEFAFMRRTLLVGLFLGITIPLIGIIMVNRKTSMMGDALSHTALAGVALGLILGINPSLGAVFVCIISAFSIEALRHRFPQYGDMATAVIMSIGLGFASILSDFTPGGNTLESYLFGSISASSSGDVIAALVLFAVVSLATIFLYSPLLTISMDSNLARLDGIPVVSINSIFTLLTAITVALSAKTVGVLLVSSLLVIPVACALFTVKSYKQMYWAAMGLGLIFMMLGLTLSWHFEIKPGGAIILLATVTLLLSALVAKIRRDRYGASIADNIAS
ncbi:MAG TPA: metal ABC transporter permease [Christensenellaceae bacterium]|jgi:zinc transport system permease protein|nr:metal ABC transporter permease [Christensenellaceae bacterium]